QPDTSITWGFLWDRVSLSRSWPAAFAIESAFDVPTDRLVAAEVARATREAREGSLPPRGRLWAIHSVPSLLAHETLEDPALRVEARLDGVCRPALVRYENRSALPRARLARLREVVPTAAAALDRTLDPDFDPSQWVVVDESGPRAVDEPTS